MGQSSRRDESSNSHRLPAFTNSPYDEDTEEIEEEDEDTEEIEEEDEDTEEIEEEDEDTDPHRVERSELVEGDHIYKWSASATYAHHGIYIGKNLVIHFLHLTVGSSSSASLSTPGLSGLFSKISKSSSSGLNSSSPSLISRHFSGVSSAASSHVSVLSSRYLKKNSSSRGNELLTCLDTSKCNKKFGTGVALDCLNCFLKRKKYSLCRYEYGVSRSTFEGEVRGGTCTTAKSGSPKEVTQRARYLLLEGFGNYHLVKNNCEDFALYCKTGLLVCNKSAPPTSGQINYALSFLSSEETLPGQVTTHGSKRYLRDIGVRNDVMKVEVENVAVVLNRRVGLNEVPAD